jgi:hypothetical protein
MLDAIDHDPIAHQVVMALEKARHEQQQQLQQLLRDNPQAGGGDRAEA